MLINNLALRQTFRETSDRERREEPVQEIGRLLSVRRKILNAYLKQRAVEEADKSEKEPALRDMFDYLSDKVDRTVVDYHEFVGAASLEMGLSDLAVQSFKNWIQISPRMETELRRMKDAGKITSDVYNKILH